MFPALLQVALGGAIGASMRYVAGVWVVRMLGQTPFPVAILAVNVVGSFLMGLFVAAAAQRGLSHLSPLVATGILGGFTTFSAFSLDAVTLVGTRRAGTCGGLCRWDRSCCRSRRWLRAWR
jgi:fluoride exporter